MTPETVVITDVGPRDGLQNQPKILTLEQRLALVQAIADAGVPQIEGGQFCIAQSGPCHGGDRSGICQRWKKLSSPRRPLHLFPI